MDVFGWLRISTHALREEGDAKKPAAVTYDIISTHALREEGDACFNLSFIHL